MVKLINKCVKDMYEWGYSLLDLDKLEEQIFYWIEDNDLRLTKEETEDFIDKVSQQL